MKIGETKNSKEIFSQMILGLGEGNLTVNIETKGLDVCKYHFLKPMKLSEFFEIKNNHLFFGTILRDTKAMGYSYFNFPLEETKIHIIEETLVNILTTYIHIFYNGFEVRINFKKEV